MAQIESLLSSEMSQAKPSLHHCPQHAHLSSKFPLASPMSSEHSSFSSSEVQMLPPAPPEFTKK